MGNELPKANEDMKITNFDKATCKLFADEAQKALAVVAAKYGVVVQPGNGKFTDSTFTSKFVFNTVTTPKTGAAGVPTEFSREAKLYGMTDADFGRVFSSFDGKRYKLSGAVVGRSKYSFLATSLQNGKTYKFMGSQVRACLDGKGYIA